MNEWQTLAPYVALGFSVAAIIFQAGSGWRQQKNILERLDQKEASEAACRAKREQNESELHARITEQGKDVSWLKGKLNGAAET